MEKDATKFLKPYLFHGVEISEDADTAKGDCPFCDKAGHFFVKAETGQYTCKRCDSQGNVASFLQQLYKLSWEQAHDKDYQALSKNRGIPVSALKLYGIVPSIIDGTWLIPGYNSAGVIANLSKVVVDGSNRDIQPTSKLTIMATPTCKQHPFGLDTLLGISPAAKINKRKKSVIDSLFICEGFWDGAAFFKMLIDAQADSVTNGGAWEAIAKQFPFPFNPATSAVIAVPGCGTFNGEWCQHFEARNVVVIFDNDHPKKSKGGEIVQPGWKSYDRVAKLTAQSEFKPKSFHVMKWGDKGFDSQLPSGYDIRDAINHRFAKPKVGNGPRPKTAPLGCSEFFTTLATKLEARKLIKATKGKSTPKKEEVPELEPYPRSSFSALMKDYDTQHYHLNQQSKDTLSVMLATVLSTQLPGDQVWLRVIGPPGSGKTTFAETISAARRYVYPLSTFRGIHSGHIDHADKSGEDASLIHKMNQKTVIIKDGDTLCNIPNRDQVLSEMRDYFDGTSRATYRNKVEYDYGDIRTTFIICGTDDLRSLSRASAGERFLDIEILGANSHKPYLDKALDATLSQLTDSLKPKNTGELSGDKLLYLKRCTLGYLQHFKGSLDRHEIEMPIMDEKAKDQVKALGQFIAYMRARVKRTGKEIAYRPRIELPTRLVSQLAKLATCLAIALGRKSIDGEVIRILRHVVISTSEGFQYDITKALANSPMIPNPDLPITDPEAKGRGKKKPEPDNPLLPKRIPCGYSAMQLSAKLRLAETNVRNTLNDMLEYGIVRRSEEGNRSGQRGRNRHVWQLSPPLLALYRFALLDK